MHSSLPRPAHVSKAFRRQRLLALSLVALLGVSACQQAPVAALPAAASTSVPSASLAPEQATGWQAKPGL